MRNALGPLAVVVFLIAVSFAVAGGVEGVAVEPGAYDADWFSPADVCGDCHGMLLGEWRGSVHAVALKDPIFLAAAREFQQAAKTPAETAETAMCVKCHAPIAYGARLMVQPSDPLEPAVAKNVDSIFCDFCHSVSGLKAIGNTGHLVAPPDDAGAGGIKHGPREEGENDFHQVAYSELHTRAEFCGGCHEVTHVVFATPLESTYSEWRAGPYHTGDPKTDVVCQDCHMRQAPGQPATGTTARPDRPGQSADGGADRPNVWRHNIVGANAILPALFGDDGQRAQMARERLQNCASLKVAVGEATRGGLVEVAVEVANDGAGHYLPTGVTELRQMWLEVTAKDAAGKTVFVSGAPDADGNLAENTALFHLVLGDPSGAPTLNIANADRVLFDYRLPPKGRRTERFSFVWPAKAKGALTVEARLLYRSVAPATARLLLGEGAPEIPVIEMTKVSLDVDAK